MNTYTAQELEVAEILMNMRDIEAAKTLTNMAKPATIDPDLAAITTGTFRGSRDIDADTWLRLASKHSNAELASLATQSPQNGGNTITANQISGKITWALSVLQARGGGITGPPISELRHMLNTQRLLNGVALRQSREDAPENPRRNIADMNEAGNQFESPRYGQGEGLAPVDEAVLPSTSNRVAGTSNAAEADYTSDSDVTVLDQDADMTDANSGNAADLITDVSRPEDASVSRAADQIDQPRSEESLAQGHASASGWTSINSPMKRQP